MPSVYNIQLSISNLDIITYWPNNMWIGSTALNYIICVLSLSRNEQRFRNEGHVMSLVEGWRWQFSLRILPEFPFGLSNKKRWWNSR